MFVGVVVYVEKSLKRGDIILLHVLHFQKLAVECANSMVGFEEQLESTIICRTSPDTYKNSEMVKISWLEGAQMQYTKESTC